MGLSRQEKADKRYGLETEKAEINKQIGTAPSRKTPTKSTSIIGNPDNFQDKSQPRRARIVSNSEYVHHLMTP